MCILCYDRICYPINNLLPGCFSNLNEITYIMVMPDKGEEYMVILNSFHFD